MKNKTINRSAKTGKFVTEAKAKRSPNTTVKETVKDNSKLIAAIRKAAQKVEGELNLLSYLISKL